MLVAAFVLSPTKMDCNNNSKERVVTGDLHRHHSVTQAFLIFPIFSQCMFFFAKEKECLFQVFVLQMSLRNVQTN